MRADGPRCVSGDVGSRNPITGIAGCCARAASGHAAAAPPSSVMNSRRLHSITSSARASSESAALSRPSALAVLRLIDQLVLGRRLHRQVGRLLALEDAIDIAGRAPVLVDQIRSVGDQAAAGDEEAVGVDRGQSVPGRQRDDQIAMNDCQCARRARSGRHSSERAKAVTARSISPASRTSTGLSSTPNDGATAWIAPNWPIPAVMAGSRRTATRVTRGAISLEQFQPFRAHAVFEQREPGGVAARPRQALDEAGADRIGDD